MKNNLPIIYAFAGRKRSGKTTLCDLMYKKLSNAFPNKVKQMSIAYNLKKLCASLLDMPIDEMLEKKDNGFVFDKTLSLEKIIYLSEKTQIDKQILENALKDKHFTTIREVLQFIGTDILRAYKPTWHIDQLIEDIKKYNHRYFITIDDVRFPNEIDALKKFNPETNFFFIIRNNLKEISNHSSETSLNWRDFTPEQIILNISTLEFLTDKFSEYIKSNWVNELFLSKNTRYYQNVPILLFRNKKLVEEILRQNISNKFFIDKGIIHHTAPDTKNALEYTSYIGNECTRRTDSSSGTFEFETFNPLFIEDLKCFL